MRVRSFQMAHKTKNATGNHKTISGVSRTSRLCVIFIKLDGHIKLIFLIKAVEAVVDINARYQSQSVNFFFRDEATYKRHHRLRHPMGH